MQLRAAARAYLEWEAEVSGFGIPRAIVPIPGNVSVSVPIAETAGLALTGSGLLEIGHGHGHDYGQSERSDRRPAAHDPASADAHARARGEENVLGSASAVPVPDLGTPPPSTPRDPEAKRIRLLALDQEVRACTRCELARGRTHTVFARGNPESAVVFVGEGPGQEEDRVGQPFVGAAGQLLDKMVGAMGFARDDVYICNVVKCRPPGNRTPLPAEAQACSSYLLGQLEAIRPRVVVALGRCAAENMGLVAGGGWRGHWGKFRGFDVMPTYHPAFLLRSPEYKRPVWEDLQKVMSKLKQPG